MIFPEFCLPLIMVHILVGTMVPAWPVLGEMFSGLNVTNVSEGGWRAGIGSPRQFSLQFDVGTSRVPFLSPFSGKTPSRQFWRKGR